MVDINSLEWGKTSFSQMNESTTNQQPIKNYKWLLCI